MRVDLPRWAGRRSITRRGDALSIGALTRHVDVERARDARTGDGFAVLARTAPLVGHYPIRTRGTFGGSIAHADPSAEWCMLAVLLDATIVVAGPDGEREIPAADFFLGFFTAALAPAELLVEVRFP